MNSLLLTLTALLILVLSALFAAPLFIDWNDYRSVFETQATNLLGRQVKVGGKVHLVLLPSPELKFDDIKVADQEGRFDRPILEARSLEAWLNIGALLSGTVEARKIAIVDPVLRLDLKEDGTGNWSDVGRRGVALPFAPKDVMLDEVGVSGGRIEITKQGVPQFTVDDIAGDASAQSLSGPYKVSATYAYEERPQDLRFSTSAPDMAGLFRIKSALRDLDRNTTYLLDGGVTGLGGKPAYDGTIVVRASNVSSGSEGEEEAEPQKEDQPAETVPRDKASLFEFKGPLKATPDRAEFPDFDLTIHAKGHPQIFKGKLTLDFGERIEAKGELAAGFVDLDALFAVPGAEDRPSPAAVLYMFADEVLAQAAEFGEGTLAVAIEQASLGGDLVGAVDLALATKDGALTIERLKAVLPGQNRIEATGRLTRGEFGPVFAGPVKVEGSGLRPLTRWAAGDRDMSGQASIGDFSFMANASIGDGALNLADASGELSGTKFRGGLRLHGGDRPLIELTLDSDRLDLREVIGEGSLWQSWLPAPGKDASAGDGQSLLTSFPDDDMRVTLRVGELLLPNIPPGKLDARFGLQSGTLDVEQLDFAAASALALNGKGRIEHLRDAPSGRVDFSLQAANADSLRIAAGLFGLPEGVSRSQRLSPLAPLDVHVSLVAAREGDATNASIQLRGKAGASDISLVARALGDPAKPGEAKIDVDGKVVGEKPQAFLVLLFPDLPLERIATPAGSQGRLVVKLSGVPNAKVTGKAALETGAIEVAFVGEGSLQPNGLALAGKGAVVSQDASAALTLLGFEAPPSAAAVPLSLRLDFTKQASTVDLNTITGSIAGENVTGSAHLDFGGAKTRFALSGSAGTLSLPSLLGVLVAWHRTPSTEEMLGAIGAGASEVWPSRGFSLGPIENAEGEITLKANTLSLGSAVKVQGATLNASVGKDGLSITDLKGRLFGGDFAASGTLSPRGTGAELAARAEVKGGKLEELAKSVAGSSLAKGPFDLAFNVQGEGLSPPGVVAGLSGEGTLSLGPGALQSLSSAPLRRVAATAAKKTIKADKEEIEAETKSVREKITKGIYKYAPAKFAFDVKNGTLRLAPATLLSTGAETKINGYLELASLKLDSEWAVSLIGPSSQDVPPVNLLFTGTLNRAGEISPAVDTAAIEAYLTMRRMQEDVERLETLDVSGRTPPPAEAEPEETTSSVPEEPSEPLVESAPVPEPEPLEQSKPTAETESPNQAIPQSSPWAKASPSAIELLQEAWQTETETVTPASTKPSEAMPTPPAAAVAPKAPAASSAAVVPESPAVAPTMESQPPAPPAEAAATPAAEPTPAAVEVVKPRPRPVRPRRPSPKPEAPDAWKKGISIFGGG
ncbi:MAG: AsmA family protein [Methyloceanibacter sp.]|nr:AsmA family protein [Methyloceanibacter sp.]